MLGRIEFYNIYNLAMMNYLINMYLNLAQLGEAVVLPKTTTRVLRTLTQSMQVAAWTSS